MTKKFYRINQQITAGKVRLIDDKGKQIGVILLEKALALAYKKSLDLIEIAPQADPPVARILNFKKFLYDEKRKTREAKKKLKEVELKEIRVSPFIQEHDLATKLQRAKGFFAQGNHVKITVKFTGRQMAHTEFGYKLLTKIKDELGKLAKTEREERLEGRNLSILFSPMKQGSRS